MHSDFKCMVLGCKLCAGIHKYCYVHRSVETMGTIETPHKIVNC